MSIRLLRYDDALDTIWDDLVYTEARLSADKRAKDLAKAVSALVARVEKVSLEQRAKWRAETNAEAVVDKCDDDLDDQVSAFSNDLSHAEGGKKNTARYKLYFGSSATDVIRLGLKSELEKIGGWVSKLKKEKLAALGGHAKAFTALASAGKAALAARTEAQSARASHRIETIHTLVDDVNAARISIAAELDTRAVKLRLPHDFSSRFFRHSTRAPKPQPQPVQAPPPAPPPS
ncbi:MAG TPA: hypothetical protein VGH28_11395 [Polyangiaceae bacterium]|jgi:hypothetical protein